MRLKLLICFKLLLTLSCTAHGNAIDDNVLLFETDSGLNALKNCQGLRVSGRHIATSPDCVELVRRNINSFPVFIRRLHGEEKDEIENLTNDFYFDALSRLGSHLLLPIKGGQVTSEQEVFFDIQKSSLPSETKVVFINETGRIESTPITLSPVDHESPHKEHKTYKILTVATFPSGSVVVNSNDEIICFIASGSMCFGPDFSFNLPGREKRFSDAICQVRHFQCSNPLFTTCLPNGNGEGECTNDHTGERCSLGVYPNGFRASYEGQTLYCNNPDGCEAVVCPKDCAKGYSSCSCKAVYKLNEVSHTIPCNCISFSDPGIPCGNQNPGGLTQEQTTAIALTVPVAIFLVTATAIVAIYYYIANKKARRNLLSGELTPFVH